MMADPKITALADDDANETVRKMIKLDEWQIPVVNSVQEKAYVGVLGLENYIDATIKTSPEKLSKDVSELMSRNVVTCSPEDEVDNIWRLMQTRSLGGLPVVKKDKLVGIVTERDFLEKGAILPTFEAKKGRFTAPSKVSSIMRTGIVTVEPSVKAIRVAKIMVSKDIGRVPVVDEEGKLIGIVDREDIARLIFE
jgi:CBS domain-containing protein